LSPFTTNLKLQTAVSTAVTTSNISGGAGDGNSTTSSEKFLEMQTRNQQQRLIDRNIKSITFKKLEKLIRNGIMYARNGDYKNLCYYLDVGGGPPDISDEEGVNLLQLAAIEGKMLIYLYRVLLITLFLTFSLWFVMQLH
jgi:hypothetical protein